MSFFLQYPALLGLLALAGLPVLVHLLSRAKPPHYRFSNVEFLRKVMRLTSRFRKPKNWLLIALRTLALLALALAFLGPLLFSKNAPLPGERRSIVLLIDRSASMAAKEGAASRFEAGCAEAGRILDEVKPDLANIVWLDAAPDAVFPEPAPNRDFLSEELSRAAPRPEPGALDAAMELALRQLAGVTGRKELHIVSDFQESAWKNFAPLVPDGVELRMVPVAKADVPNLGVSALVPVPVSPVAGQQMIAQCRVANHSDEARSVSLTLDAGGSRQSQVLDLPPRGEAEAAFTVRCAAAGLLPFTAEIDGDGFPGDDRRHAMVRVRESIRLAVAGPPDGPVAKTLERVAGALPWLDSLPAGDTGRLPPCEILCVPDFQNSDVPVIRDLASKGTAVLVLSGPNSSAGAVAGLFGEKPEPIHAHGGLQTSDAGWEASPAADHPAFRLFAGGEFGNPLGGKFKARVPLLAPSPARLVASFGDGRPALLEARDAPLMLCNLSLDPEFATWSGEPAFLPAIAELLLYLTPRGAAETFELPPGEAPVWTDRAPDAAGPPVLQAPDGSLPPLVAAGQSWRSEASAIPGIYQWLVSGQAVHLNLVNFPESESLLKPMASIPGAGPAASPGVSAARRAALQHGLPLWPWLIAAALAFLVIEGWVAGLKPSTRTA
jgi:hypothetical protein